MREPFPEEELLARMDALLRRHRPHSAGAVSEITQEIPLLTEIVNELAKVEDVPSPDAGPRDVLPASGQAPSVPGASSAPGASGSSRAHVSPPSGLPADLEGRVRNLLWARLGTLVEDLTRGIVAELGAPPSVATAHDGAASESIDPLGTPAAPL